MKKLLLAAAMISAVSTLTLASTAQAGDLKTLETDEQKVSYSFGVMLGQRMKQDVPQVDMEAFTQGMKDAMGGSEPLLTQAQMQAAIQQYQQKQQMDRMAEYEQMSAENLNKGTAFLDENKGKPGVKITASGLQYKVLTAGAGKTPGPTDTVKVHYEGSLIDGSVFDSSIQRGEPVSFPVNGVIAGWTEALQLMREGDKWQLFIPSELAYGPGGNRSIGPNEVLLFDVELLEVQKK